MLHPIRCGWGGLKETSDSPVAADETCRGGRRINMNNVERKELMDTGRGTVDKTAVAGVKDRATTVTDVLGIVGKRLMYRPLITDGGLPPWARG